jgi:hypothetical protein
MWRPPPPRLLRCRQGEQGERRARSGLAGAGARRALRHWLCDACCVVICARRRPRSRCPWSPAACRARCGRARLPRAVRRSAAALARCGLAIGVAGSSARVLMSRGGRCCRRLRCRTGGGATARRPRAARTAASHSRSGECSRCDVVSPGDMAALAAESSLGAAWNAYGWESGSTAREMSYLALDTWCLYVPDSGHAGAGPGCPRPLACAHGVVAPPMDDKDSNIGRACRRPLRDASQRTVSISG